MVEARERRILEFPLGMDPREVAKELKREGLVCLGVKLRFSDRARAGKSGDRGMTCFLFRLHCPDAGDQPTSPLVETFSALTTF